MSFDPKHFKDLAGAEEGNYWFVNRNALIVWALKRYAADTRKFLEVGCGTGFVLAAVSKAFPAADITATEMYAEGLEFAKTRVPMATFQQADAEHLGFEHTFDTIGSFDVIEHIENDVLVLQNLYTALKPAGSLVISVPQHQFLWSAADEIAHHKRRYSRTELVTKVEQAGFDVIKVTSFVSFLFPLMVMSRLKHKTNQSFDVTDEMKLPALLNALFLAILTAERALIQCGVTFPFGGSLLLVAKKRDKV